MNSVDDSLPEAFHALVAVFDNALADVRFPGVDGDVLRAHQTDVASAQAAVQQAEQALADARAALKERELAALDRGERALAYLRVFAADNETIASAIAGLSLSRQQPKPVATETAKRRGRPRKTENDLFIAPPVDTVGDGAAAVDH